MSHFNDEKGSPAPERKTGGMRREDLAAKCEEIRKSPNILSKVSEDLRVCGFVGETGPVALIYLATFTRFFRRPVSIALKGESAVGKSTVLKSALGYVSPDAYFEISGMSEKALIHMDEDLRHRHLVIGEFAGLQNRDGNKWLRMLLSEGELAYTVTVPDLQNGGHKAVTKRREGPTGCFLTTTEGVLHSEDETRLLSVPIVGGVERTRSVLVAQGAEFSGAQTADRRDREPWLAFSDWVALGEKRVILPFAQKLAERVDAHAERIKRDFPQVLSLTAAHAMIHQENRERSPDGSIIGTEADYESVYPLLKPIIEEANEATVRPELAKYVEAIVSAVEVRAEYVSGVPQVIVRKKLNLTPSQSSRLKDEAVRRGYLHDLSPGEGYPSQLVPAMPLPKGRAVIPAPDELAENTEAEVTDV
jgi:hypothetical protein